MPQLIVTVNKLNKRTSIPGSVGEKSSIAGIVYKGYKFQGTFIPSTPNQYPGGWYKDRDGYYYWAGGVAVQEPPESILNSLEYTVTGIDVSRYQSSIQWNVVKTAISFVYIKATEGLFTTDTLCSNHANGAKAAGIKIGYYHFGLVSKDPVGQAKHFHDVISTMPAANLMPVLDIEINKANLTSIEMESWITTFINTLKNLGYPQVMIYSCYSFLNQNLPPTHNLGSYPLWLAEYSSLPAPKIPVGWNTFLIWQYKDDGNVGGINGEVDMDRALNGFA